MTFDRRSFLRFLGLGAAAAVVAPALPALADAGVTLTSMRHPTTWYVGAASTKSYLTAVDAWSLSPSALEVIEVPLSRTAWFSKIVRDGIRPIIEQAYDARREEFEAIFNEVKEALGTIEQPFATLQEAIDAAREGDTIQVMPSHTEVLPADGWKVQERNLTIKNLQFNHFNNTAHGGISG